MSFARVKVERKWYPCNDVADVLLNASDAERGKSALLDFEMLGVRTNAEPERLAMLLWTVFCVELLYDSKTLFSRTLLSAIFQCYKYQVR